MGRLTDLYNDLKKHAVEPTNKIIDMGNNLPIEQKLEIIHANINTLSTAVNLLNAQHVQDMNTMNENTKYWNKVLEVFQEQIAILQERLLKKEEIN